MKIVGVTLEMKGFVPQYTLIYKHLLNSFEDNLVKLEDYILQQTKKLSFQICTQEATINDFVSLILQMFPDSKMIVTFYEQWKVSHKDILSDKLGMRNFFGHSEILAKNDPFTEAGGIALGGLAFIFDICEVLTQSTDGITKFMTKMVIFQAFFGKYFK